MSEDPEQGAPPRKDTRFKKGQSGNPRGRPLKPRRTLVPSQLRKDILRVADEVMEIRTAAGVRKLTKHELIIMAISNGAAKGNPTCLRIWMKLIEAAVDERFRTYGTVRLVDTFIRIVEDPQFPPKPFDVLALDAHLKAIKRSY